MFILGPSVQTVKWQAAGITLDMIPLPETQDQAFIRETLTEVREHGKIVDVKRDYPRYAQLVGNYCIKGWSGVYDADGHAQSCVAETIDQFMLIGPAQDFVFNKVKNLDLYLREEINAGKPASSSACAG